MPDEFWGVLTEASQPAAPRVPKDVANLQPRHGIIRAGFLTSLGNPQGYAIRTTSSTLVW